MVGIMRTIAILALLAVNAWLVVLNLQKHELFPFEPTSGAEQVVIIPGPGE